MTPPLSKSFPDDDLDPLTLSTVLVLENVSLPAYAVMLALLRAGGKMGLMKLAIRVGQSYWAVRNHIRRTPYFEYEALPKAKLCVRITEAGRAKHLAIVQRVKAMKATEMA